MADVNYRDVELSSLKYIKVVYTDFSGKMLDIRTDVDFLSDKYISVYINEEKDLNMKCPQEVMLKFITEEAVYVGKTTLLEIKYSKKSTYLTIISPSKLTRQQNRRYCRIKVDRVCILIATDKNGNNAVYMSRLIDVSAGGVLIHQLETLFDDNFITIEPSDYEKFNIVLILGTDIVLKLCARYVRQEKGSKSQKYAFEFIEPNEKNIDIISKFVTQEQVSQLKLRSKFK